MLKKRWIGLIVLLMVLSQACVLTSFLPKSVKSGDVLFQDDFTDPESGWTTYDEGGSSVAYKEDGLHVLVNKPYYDLWSQPGKSYKNVNISVSATRVAGTQNNDYGLMCRFVDRNNTYLFLISSDGYYGILKVLDGEYYLLTGKEMQFSDVINQGEDPNQIRADCVGQTLTLYVNDTMLVEVKDSDLKEGDVGVNVGAYKKAGVEIVFNDFIVTAP